MPEEAVQLVWAPIAMCTNIGDTMMTILPKSHTSVDVTCSQCGTIVGFSSLNKALAVAASHLYSEHTENSVEI